MHYLNIPEFTTIDVLFLHEYVKVLEPIAKAIDTLQAECYFAYLLPVVHKTVRDLEQMDNKFKFCQPLLVAVLQGVKERFNYCFDFDDDQCKMALIATCTHPYFKTRWLHGPFKTAANYKKIRDTLISAACTIEVKTQTNKKCATLTPGNYIYLNNYFLFTRVIRGMFQLGKKNKGFDFGLDESMKNLVDKELEAETDITAFLRKSSSDEKDLSQLNQHPFIAELFKKFNAICTSSAPAERLFSQAGMF